MKRFICVFISICLIISCITISAFADYNENIDLVANSIYCKGTISFLYFYGTQWDTSFIIQNEYLPILNRGGIPYSISQQQGLKFGTIELTSDAPFDGYYSFYLFLEFHSDTSDPIAYGNLVADLELTGLHIGNSVVYPNVEVWQNQNHGSYPQSNCTYKFNISMKWDFSASNISSIDHSASESVTITIPYGQWIIVPCNASIVKYPSQQSAGSINDLASLITQQNSVLSNYLPQIVQSLAHSNQMLTYIQDHTNNLNSNLDDIVDQWLPDFIEELESLYDFLDYNFTEGSSSGTIWNLLYELYFQLTSAGAGNNNSLWQMLMRYSFANTNIFYYNRNSDSITWVTDSNRNLLMSVFYYLKSINNFLTYNFVDNQNIKDSEGYIIGDQLQSNIDDNNGYQALGQVATGASGFGNIGQAGNLFNGFSSAFRWFSTETKNDIDAVPQTRSSQEPISNYYYQNQERILEFLTPEETLNDQPNN